MAYNKTEIFETVKEISLSEGCSMLKDKFKNEKEFTENLLPKLEGLIKTAFWLNEFKNGI